MTSALPRLSNQQPTYNNTVSQYRSPVRQEPNGYSSAQKQVISSQQKGNQNFQLQNIREATLKKFESYNTRLRQLDRSFTLQLRKTDQQSTRALSKVTSSVSSLSAEMQQLHNQSAVLSRKLNQLQKSMQNLSTNGLQNALRPINEGFQNFDSEFAKSIQNVNALFSTLERRCKSASSDYQSLLPVVKSVTDYEATVEELETQYKQSVQNMEDMHEEFSDLIQEQRNTILQKLNSRIQSLVLKIDALEKRSAAALDQSQTIIADSQKSQFEMRQKFEETTDQSIVSFTKRLDQIKNSLNDMNKSRYEQLTAIRQRLSAASESMSKLKRKKLKEAAIQENHSRVSLKPEIDALSEKVNQLEALLERKMGHVPSKDEDRVFYQIQPDQTVKYITIKSDGTVVI